MEIYITSLLQILSFSSCFRRFEIKNFVAPQNIFHLYGPETRMIKTR